MESFVTFGDKTIENAIGHMENIEVKKEVDDITLDLVKHQLPLDEIKYEICTDTEDNKRKPEIKLSGDESKKKWKNLKDTFRKKVQTLQSKSASAASPPHNKWKFETHMEFIRDILPSSMIGNLTSPPVDEEEEDATSIDTEITETNDNKQQGTTAICSEDDDRFSRPHRSKRSTRQKEDMQKRLMELEEKKINTILNLGKQTDDIGDDHHFFLSLLPYVTRLDALEKLQLRSKIQSCVFEAVRDHETRKVHQQYTSSNVSSSNASSSFEVRHQENNSFMNQSHQTPQPNENCNFPY